MIGRTRLGRAVYRKHDANHEKYVKFNSGEHFDAAVWHNLMSVNGADYGGPKSQKHDQLKNSHLEMAKEKGLHEAFEGIVNRK